MKNLENHYGFIYKTTLPNGKIYIGQSTNFNWERYLGSGTKLLEFFKENGTKNSFRQILKFVNNQKDLDKWEKIFILKSDSTNPNIGLNIQLGGSGRNSFSEIVKLKISKSVSKTMTNERRQLISNQHKGKIITEETRKRNSLASKGINNAMYGKKGINSPMYNRKWITNEIDCKFIDVSKGIPQGYRLGRIFKNKL